MVLYFQLYLQPEQNLSQAVRYLFDGIAHRYDFLNHFLSLGRDINWRKKAVRSLQHSPGDQVLDLCGGTGDFLNSYMREVTIPALGLLADFSLGMLNGARGEKFPRNKVPARVQMDALKPCLKPEKFDTVLCGYGMRNLDNLTAGIQAVQGLLKAGGHFVTLEFFRPSSPLPRFFYGLLAPLFIPLLGFLFSRRKGAYDYLIRSIRGFHSVSEYASLLEQQGFTLLQILPCDAGISHIVVARKTST